MDINSIVAYIMAPKDEKELNIIKRSALCTVDLFKKYYWEEIMKAVDQDKVRFDWLIEWVNQWLIDWLIDWVIDWLIDWLVLIIFLLCWVIVLIVLLCSQWFFCWCRKSSIRKLPTEWMWLWRRRKWCRASMIRTTWRCAIPPSSRAATSLTSSSTSPGMDNLNLGVVSCSGLLV